MFEGYYTLKMSDLKATKLEGSDNRYNASDFANSNLLLQKEANSLMNGSVLPIAVSSSNAKVFPNPVTNSSFNILFDNNKAGKYTIVVSDLAGRVVLTKTANVNAGKQTQKINLNSNSSKGVYVVRVLDENNLSVVNEKIVIQ
jgi:hypothetical protein